MLLNYIPSIIFIWVNCIYWIQTKISFLWWKDTATPTLQFWIDCTSCLWISYLLINGKLRKVRQEMANWHLTLSRRYYSLKKVAGCWICNSKISPEEEEILRWPIHTPDSFIFFLDSFLQLACKQLRVAGFHQTHSCQWIFLQN